MPRPERRRGASWATVEEIKALIRKNRLVPGSPLPTEAELCDELGVSRSSVREAMRTLASLDIVEVRHGHGTYVGGLSLSPLVNGLVFRGALNVDGTFKTLRDVVELRVALDLGATTELIRAYHGTSSPTLHGIVETMRDRWQAGQSFMEEDRAFHTQLLTGVDNAVLRELVAAFWEVHSLVVPSLGIPPDADMRKTVDSHGLMLSALEQGDADAYRAAVQLHYAPLKAAIATFRAVDASQRSEGTQPGATSG